MFMQSPQMINPMGNHMFYYELNRVSCYFHMNKYAQRR